MANHTSYRQFLAKLPTQDRERLIARNNRSAVLRLLVLIILISALIVGIVKQVTLWGGLMLPLGVLLVFLFTLMHETTHKTAFKSAWINYVISRLSGLIIMMPPHWFEAFHFAHHRHTHCVDKDPEMAYPKPTTLTQYVLFISGLPIALSQIKLILSNAFKGSDANYISVIDRPKIKQEARWMLAIYLGAAVISIWLQSSLLITVWLLPLLLGQPFLRLFLLAEHHHCANDDNMFANTRTTYTNSLLRFLTWEMSYHVEHHVLPAVPFHQLAAFHEKTKPHCEVLQSGYAKLHLSWIKQYCFKR